MLNSEGKMHPLVAGLHFLGSKYIVHHFTLMQSKSEKRVKREIWPEKANLFIFMKICKLCTEI